MELVSVGLAERYPSFGVVFVGCAEEYAEKIVGVVVEIFDRRIVVAFVKIEEQIVGFISLCLLVG